MSLNKPMRDGRVSGTAHRHVYGWKGWLVFTGPVGQWLGQRRAARLVSFLNADRLCVNIYFKRIMLLCFPGVLSVRSTSQIHHF